MKIRQKWRKNLKMIEFEDLKMGVGLTLFLFKKP
jgi:hypothetical protein